MSAASRPAGSISSSRASGCGSPSPAGSPEQLERRLPKVAALLEEAEPDVLAFYAFPAEHWPKVRSTNPLERFNREIARRTDVVGIFPDDASLIRLVSMLAIEANDCHEGGPAAVRSSPRRTLGAVAATAPTRGGHAVSRDRLGHPAR